MNSLGGLKNYIWLEHYHTNADNLASIKQCLRPLTVPLGVISRLCSVIVTLPGHYTIFFVLTVPVGSFDVSLFAFGFICDICFVLICSSSLNLVILRCHCMSINPLLVSGYVP